MESGAPANFHTRTVTVRAFEDLCIGGKEVWASLEQIAADPTLRDAYGKKAHTLIRTGQDMLNAMGALLSQRD